MPVALRQVDAFTATAFAGNPAAVCLLSGPRDETWMQAVAAEMNLSETAFVAPRDDGFDLRWFTPACEVDLCGHATLATAHVLYEDGLVAPGEPIRFATRSGWLTAWRAAPGIEMDFPALEPRTVPAPPGVEEALGAPVVAVAAGGDDLLVELAAEEQVRELSPAFDTLARLPYRGTIVTAPAARANGYDFVSRFFAPAVGIAEDPVTGSSHCALGPWWAARLGRDALTGYQASGRGGTVRVRVDGPRVVLGGDAVTVVRGELT